MMTNLQTVGILEFMAVHDIYLKVYMLAHDYEVATRGKRPRKAMFTSVRKTENSLS